MVNNDALEDDEVAEGWVLTCQALPTSRIGAGESMTSEQVPAMTRVAVVTGGASGMGEAICHELGRRGHKVAVLDLDGEAAQRVSEELRADGVTALAVAADVSDRSAVEEAFAKMRSELGPVHILVTSAGLVDFAPFTEITTRGLGASDRGEPDRDVPLLSGRGAGHGGGGMGPHRDDLVVERAAGFAEDGALRRVARARCSR